MLVALLTGTKTGWTHRNPAKKTMHSPILFLGLNCNFKMIGKGRMKRTMSATTPKVPITIAEVTGLEHLANAVASQGAPLLGIQ
jgi:hypothetical protein